MSRAELWIFAAGFALIAVVLSIVDSIFWLPFAILALGCVLATLGADE